MTVKNYTAEWWSYLSKSSKYQGLDLLRAIAIVIVVVWHFSPLLTRIGWIGVDLFFVLSGFLIGGSIFRGIGAGHFNTRSYLADRFLRIYPLYFLAVLAYGVRAWFVGWISDFTTLFSVIAAHAVFLQTLTRELWGLDLPFYGPTWSLVVEIWFYLTIPFLLFFFCRFRVVWVGLALLACIFLWLRYLVTAHLNPEDINWYYYYQLRPYFRYDELLFGVGVAYAVSKGIHKFRVPTLVLGLVGLIWICHYIWVIPKADQIASVALLSTEVITFPTLLALAFSAIVYGIYDKSWSCAPINVLARLAYPMYLVHVLVVTVTDSLVLHLFLVVSISALASYLVEYPFIRLYKKRRQPRTAMDGVPRLA